MNTRRDFLKQSLLGAGALAFAKDSSWAAQPGKPPMRFIFMHRGNGLWPRVMVPPGLDEKTLEKEKRQGALSTRPGFARPSRMDGSTLRPQGKPHHPARALR